MKQLLLGLKSLLLLLCMIGGSGSMWATAYISYNGNTQDTSTTISTQNVSSGSAGAISWTGTSCSYSSNRVNIAANGSITFTASSGNVITKIVITSGSSATYYGTWTSTPSVTPSSSSGTTTFDNLSASSVTVTTSTAFRCTSASDIKIYYTQLSYTFTAESNNESYGTVTVSGNKITAAPNEGYRVSTTNPYEVTGSATVVQSGNEFTVTPTSECTVKINFEAIPTHTVTFYQNGENIGTSNVAEGATIIPPSATATIEDKTFVGWVSSSITGTTNEAPSFANLIMGETDLTYYAVYAIAEAGVPEEKLAQTLQYDTWTYSGSTTDKTSYRLFHSNSYILSNAFDLSTLSKVVVYGGTFGGDSYNSLTISDNSNPVNKWKDVTVSKNSETGVNTFTGGTALSGTGQLKITSNSGTASSSGVRISKVEIYVTQPTYTYSEYCTTVAADNREKVNITSFSATSATLLAGNTTTTTVENDQSGWTAAYTYSSDDETVATVSNTGVITGVGAGKTNIKVTLNVDSNDENYKAGTEKSKTVEITVNALKTPQISPNGGKILAATSVTISSEDGNAVKIYYSTDGTTPSVEYTGAFNVEPGTKVKAVAKNLNDENYTSETAEAEFKTGNVINLTTETISFVANTSSNNTFTITGSGYQTDDEIEFSATNGNDYTWEIKDCMNSTTAATKYYLQIKSGGYAATSVVSPNGFVLTLVSSGTEPTVTFGGTEITKADGVYTINAKSGELKISGGTSYVGTITLSPILPETYTRDVTAGNFGTICVPFGVDAAGIEGATFYTISGKKMNGDALEAITLEEATSLTAGVGYIFKATDSQVTLTSNFTSVDTPVTTGAVIGTFDDEFQVPDNMYILSSNKIYGTGTTRDGWIRKNRAYIDLTNVSETNEVKGIALFNVDVATGIDTIKSAEENDVIFNMAGQRVKKPVRGLYIINGKKVFVK